MSEKEFNHIILPLTKNLYSYALHLTRNREDAADIVQEVMVKLWNKRKELKKIKKPKAWALKITRNLCLDFARRHKPLYGEEIYLGKEIAEKDTLEQISVKDTADIVKKLIETLPPNQKEVLVLREIEELEYEEISAITGLEINHLRVLLSRARSRIKDLYTQKYLTPYSIQN